MFININQVEHNQIFPQLFSLLHNTSWKNINAENIFISKSVNQTNFVAKLV